MRYISKDFVISGSLIDLSDAEAAWAAFDKRVRTSVRKGERMGVKIRPFEMKDLPIVTAFTPNDDDIPAAFEDRHHAYIAEVEETGEILGWILLAGVGRKLFMLCHASRPEGKARQTPNLLLWHAVKTWAGGPYSYFDVGASYRKTLQDYFTGFQQLEYPMIMRPPDEPTIHITRTPFTSDVYAIDPGDAAEGERKLIEMVGSAPMTFFPNGLYMIRSIIRECMDEERCANGEKLLVVSTFGAIPNRITQAAEGICSLTTDARDRIGAILVVHDFGIPVSLTDEMRSMASERGTPIIEDLSEGWGSEGTGIEGAIRLYDYSRLFPVQFGAVAVGIEIPFDRMWNIHGCFDLQKKEIALSYLAVHGRSLEEIKSERQRVWKRYASNLVSVCDSAIEWKDEVMPYVFVASVGSDEEAETIVTWLKRFNVESDVWRGHHAVLLPCHQAMSDRRVDYVSGAFLAMFRERCGLPH
jgi:hypothetical protein